MLDHILKSTSEFLECKPKAERKKIGQFFTSKETAIFMASLFNMLEKESLYILDPGAGSGILIAALVDSLQTSSIVKTIAITCYENNSCILPVLQSNMEFLKANSKVKIEYRIIDENYILTQKDKYNNKDNMQMNMNVISYDMIIGNPPYLKISKDAPEAIAMPDVCYGAPNLYFLFVTMSLFNLKDDGEMVYIIPRSWTSGAYFKRFRENLLKYARLTHIHLFVSRDKVFDNEHVLQETIIIKAVKTQKVINNIQISSSASNKEFSKRTSLKVPYNVVISGRNMYVFLVTSLTDIKILNKLNQFSYKLEDVGVKMKTGLTVDFRNRDLLRLAPDTQTIPLFYSQHIKNGYVQFPIGKDFEYILDAQPGLMQDNKNYLFIKRFAAKEEKRRLQCGIYLSSNFPQFKAISTQNKINFIDTLDGSEMSAELVYGLYVIFNSTIYDSYYRILNGSTQVNSNEINSMPVPSKQALIQLGKNFQEKRCFSVNTCDTLLEGLFS